MGQSFFSNSGFMPHIHCYLGTPSLVFTMLVTDLLIGFAYVGISFTLWALIRRTQIPYSLIIICFGVFIGACGATHFMEVWTMWNPDYWVSASVKVVTAIASVGTGVYLYRLRHTIAGFADSIRLSEGRKRELEDLTQNLEKRVRERTQELEQLGTRFMRVSSATDLGIWYSDLPLDKLHLSTKTKEHLWLPEDAEINIDQFYERVHPDDREPIRQAVESSINLRAPYDIEYRSLHPTQPHLFKWIRAIGWTVYENGKPVSFDGITLDVTERKKRETEKEQIQGDLIELLERTTDGFFIIDRDWKMSYANPVTKNFFAIAGMDVIGKPMVELFPSQDRLKFMQHYEEIARTGVADRFEEVYEGHVLQVHAYRTREQGVAVFYRDVTEQVVANNRLKESENRYATLTKSIPQLVWTCSSDGSCNYLSQQWEDYTGIPAEQQLGLNWLERVIHPDDKQRTLAHWMGAVEEKHRYDIEYRIRRFDGEYRWFQTRGTPMRDSHGRIIYWVGTCTDVHGAKELEERLREAVTKANEANELKSAFLANMSHEIRTPLGAVLGFTDLLRDENISATEAESYHGIIKRNGEQLSNLINDILDLSKVEAGQFRADIRQTSIKDVVEDVCVTLSRNAEEKALELKCEVEKSVPLFIGTDPIRLRQILMNVVGNAIKFTHQGSVFVKASSAGNSMIKLSIEDTGIGITEDQKKSLFQPFSQADVSITRKYGGTGLGLILSRKLSQALGGDLQLAESTPLERTVFEVTLKDLLPNSEMLVDKSVSNDQFANAVQARQTKDGGLEGHTILIVDDSPDNRHLLSRILTRQGAEVAHAANGAEAVKLARENHFSIVLMDIQMPVMDGYTAISELRSGGYQTPIIALTAHAMNEVRLRTLSVGASDHLTKPVNTSLLNEKIRRWLGRTP